MSGTPETDAAVMAAGGDWSFPLRECSRRLERQRDEAQEKYDNLATEHMLSINKICNERDEAREKIERQADIGCAFQKTNPAMCGRYKQERDEAQEKYATEATEHMLAINKLCNERDEAREEVRTLKGILDLLKKEAQ